MSDNLELTGNSKGLESVLKDMPEQEIVFSTKDERIMTVRAVRKHKGVPQGMIYPEGEEPRLVLHVRAPVKSLPGYWVPVYS